MPDYATLREANVARQVEWMKGATAPMTLSFRGNELAGEAGELAEALLMKWAKYSHMKEQWSLHLAEELGDVVICADLVCIDADVPLPHNISLNSRSPDHLLLAVLLKNVGRLCNSIKKYERSRMGITGGKTLDPSKVMISAGEVYHSAACIAQQENIDLDVAVARKFNLTSTKNGLQTLLIPPGYDRARLIPTGEHSYA